MTPRMHTCCTPLPPPTHCLLVLWMQKVHKLLVHTHTHTQTHTLPRLHRGGYLTQDCHSNFIHVVDCIVQLGEHCTDSLHMHTHTSSFRSCTACGGAPGAGPLYMRQCPHYVRCTHLEQHAIKSAPKHAAEQLVPVAITCTK